MWVLRANLGSLLQHIATLAVKNDSYHRHHVYRSWSIFTINLFLFLYMSNIFSSVHHLLLIVAIIRVDSTPFTFCFRYYQLNLLI